MIHSSFSGNFMFFVFANFSITNFYFYFCRACYSTTTVCSKHYHELGVCFGIIKVFKNLLLPFRPSNYTPLCLALLMIKGVVPIFPYGCSWDITTIRNLQIPEHHASWSVYGRSVWNLWRDAWQTIGCQQCVDVLLAAASVWFPFPSVAS